MAHAGSRRVVPRGTRTVPAIAPLAVSARPRTQGALVSSAGLCLLVCSSTPSGCSSGFPRTPARGKPDSRLFSFIGCFAAAGRDASAPSWRSVVTGSSRLSQRRLPSKFIGPRIGPTSLLRPARSATSLSVGSFVRSQLHNEACRGDFLQSFERSARRRPRALDD